MAYIMVIARLLAGLLGLNWDDVVCWQNTSARLPDKYAKWDYVCTDGDVIEVLGTANGDVRIAVESHR